MSDITASRPEVVNGHTDVICSTSICRILAVRKSTLLQIDTLIRQLADISVLTESIGGKTARDWAMKQDFRCGCWLMDKPETAMKAITRNLDREIWRDLMQRSGMLSLIAKWHLNRSQFGIRIDHDLAFISDHSLASQSITIWHASDH